MCDQYTIEGNLIYRIDQPRNKKLATLKPVRTRLCVPLKFRHAIVSHLHDSCSHYATEKLFFEFVQSLLLAEFVQRCV